ncbi:MAG TPA: RHS repeat-associated core domain-containing protein, partial [Victivallales bacterium]|nr:RHS repeat-associated core domain-containing protein [Victivallales bacterium]
TWVHEKATTGESMPYKFTSKELDPETGLYYFGARYYDARLSRWMSTDPAFTRGTYFPNPKDFDMEHDYFWYLKQDASKKLPGIGGVFNEINLDLYHYAGNNPVKYVDPDGKMFLPFIAKAIEYIISILADEALSPSGSMVTTEEELAPLKNGISYQEFLKKNKPAEYDRLFGEVAKTVAQKGIDEGFEKAGEKVTEIGLDKVYKQSKQLRPSRHSGIKKKLEFRNKVNANKIAAIEKGEKISRFGGPMKWLFKVGLFFLNDYLQKKK